MMATLISAQSEGSLADKAASSLIGALDGDKSGSLSLTEVQSALLGEAPAAGASDAASSVSARIAQGFAKLDTNGDGQLGADELASAMRTLEQRAASSVGRHHHHHHSDTQQAAVTPPAASPAAPAGTPSNDSGSSTATTSVATSAGTSTSA